MHLLCFFCLMTRRPPRSTRTDTLSPYTTLFRSRYLVLGILAMALSLSWGYAGILNLGQAMSFGLGSYCMAMALKLRTVPVHTGSEGLPDFMVWNNVTELPWFWQPFYSLPFAQIGRAHV